MTAKFITISYSDDLAHNLASLTRYPMQSEILPTNLSRHRARQAGRRSRANDEGWVSLRYFCRQHHHWFGADEIIVDDPMQPDDAASEHVKERVRNWMSSSVLTPFNDQSKGGLIIVMHRLAPNDLPATMTDTADRISRLPLIAEKHEKFTFKGEVIFERNPGDVLNPERLSFDEAQKLKKSMPRHVWDGQYQQRPTAGGSGMFSIERFKRYDRAKPPPFELTIHSWDVGATIKGNASVWTKWGLPSDASGQDILYLLQIIRIRAELPEVHAAVAAEDARDKPALIIIDSRGVGLGLYQALSRGSATSCLTHSIQNLWRAETKHHNLHARK